MLQGKALLKKLVSSVPDVVGSLGRAMDFDITHVLSTKVSKAENTSATAVNSNPPANQTTRKAGPNSSSRPKRLTTSQTAKRYNGDFQFAFEGCPPSDNGSPAPPLSLSLRTGFIFAPCQFLTDPLESLL